MFTLHHALVVALSLVGAVAAGNPEPVTLLVSTTAPADLPECIANSYRGHHGEAYVFALDEACASQASFSSLSEGSLIPLGGELADSQLMFLRFAGVEDHVFERERRPLGRRLSDAYTDFKGYTNWFWDVFTHPLPAPRDPQNIQAIFDPQHLYGPESVKAMVFQNDPENEEHYAPPASYVKPEIVHARDEWMLVRVHDADVALLDRFLPPQVVAVAVSPTPIPYVPEALADNKWGVPKEAAEHLAKITKHLAFNPDIAEMVGTLSADDILSDVQYLTGERADSDIESRNSFHPDARKAVLWLATQMRETGATCEYFGHEGLIGFSPVLICTYPRHSDSEKHVILSAHYDSRGYFGTTRAPGADDDGSGTAHLLSIGRAIGRHNLTFEHPLSLAFFSGEEQGLWGSHYFAQHLKQNNATVQLNVNADMLGYRVPGEPMQLALPATIELAEAGYLVGNMSKLYAPELVVGRTAACCSDHQSFLEYGFPATHVFERNGPIADPMYHASDDLSDREGFDAEQIRSIAKVTMATVLEVAGWSRDKQHDAEAWKFVEPEATGLRKGVSRIFNDFADM